MPCTVWKVVLVSPSFCVAVHQANEGFLTTGNVISKCDTGIVPGLNNNAFVQIGHRNLIASLRNMTDEPRRAGLPVARASLPTVTMSLRLIFPAFSA